MEKLIHGVTQLGLSLTVSQLEQFEAYYQELVDWNQHINLTSIVEYEAVQLRHFLDSLTLAPLLTQEGCPRVLDLGAGAGLPGVPLKILLTSLRLTLIDSVAKKTRFLSHLVSRLGLEGVQVRTGRAEELAHDQELREGFDFVLSRGVAGLPTLVELALPFCKVGGLFIAQKGSNIEQELGQARYAMECLGSRVREVRLVYLEGLLEKRTLVVIEKQITTPAIYPRRIGVPFKRPLQSTLDLPRMI